MWQAYYVWRHETVFVIEYHCRGRGRKVLQGTFCERDHKGLAIRLK